MRRPLSFFGNFLNAHSNSAKLIQDRSSIFRAQGLNTPSIGTTSSFCSKEARHPMFLRSVLVQRALTVWCMSERRQSDEFIHVHSNTSLRHSLLPTSFQIWHQVLHRTIAIRSTFLFETVEDRGRHGYVCWWIFGEGAGHTSPSG